MAILFLILSIPSIASSLLFCFSDTSRHKSGAMDYFLMFTFGNAVENVFLLFMYFFKIFYVDNIRYTKFMFYFSCYPRNNILRYLLCFC
jgi:hypothetical protein